VNNESLSVRSSKNRPGKDTRIALPTYFVGSVESQTTKRQSGGVALINLRKQTAFPEGGQKPVNSGQENETHLKEAGRGDRVKGRNYGSSMKPVRRRRWRRSCY